MLPLRRLSLFALGVAFLHIVFGAIVRISGAGMGCGDSWPKCQGSWLPPLDSPILAIEWTHRLLALVVLVTTLALVLTAWAKHPTASDGFQYRVFRSAALAFAVTCATAVLGFVTVRLSNVWFATALHWVFAAATLAALAVTAVRAGGLGGVRATAEPVSARTARGAAAASVLALLVVTVGGLTAKVPGANSSCLGFPHCRIENPGPPGALAVHIAHRILAALLVLHMLGLVLGMRKREEVGVVTVAARTAFLLLALQVLVAAALVETGLPAALRSLHQVFGVSIWLAVFTFAYLARLASGPAPAAREARARVMPPAPRTARRPDAVPDDRETGGRRAPGTVRDGV